jgi:uncharacterized protein YraI
MVKWLLSMLVVLAVLAALPTTVLAAPPGPSTPTTPEPEAQPEAPVTVQAVPNWGAPLTVRSWYGLRLREGPGIYEPVILVLANGETVYPGAGPVWADGYSWTFVKVYRYGLVYQGFCATMYLSGGGTTPPAQHGLKVTAQAGLRLRYGPGLNAAIYTVVPMGTILQGTGNHALSDGTDWTEVTYGSLNLWAASMYLVAV